MEQVEGTMREVPYVLFGGQEYPTKTLQAFWWSGIKGAGVSICEIRNDDHKYQYGDAVSNDDISGRYFNLWFCRKESVDAFINGLVELKKIMEKNDAEG